MRAVVTGAAGFIGSRVTESLLEAGWSVTGVDAFRPTYDVAVKRGAVQRLARFRRWEMVEGDLAEMELASLLEDVDLVVHLAARANARASWHDDFDRYLRDNVYATERVLEAALAAAVGRLVFASSSSVYGEVTGPASEEATPRPVSPYGTTKAMAEGLVQGYEQLGLDAVIVRYFTVYGPGQRSDMAFHRLIQAALSHSCFEVYGDGTQARDFTYVDDAVAGTIAAAERGRRGGIYNLAGGISLTLLHAVSVVSELTGHHVSTRLNAIQRGDVRRTVAAITRAREDLGFVPQWTLDEGLAQQIDWQRSVGSCAA